MSHRDDCMSRREAERQGERDFERRGYRTYYPPDEIRGCYEAERAYQDGQRRAEYRAEEEAEQERIERNAEQRRHERERAASAEYEEYERREHEEHERLYEWMMEVEIAIAEVWGEGP